MARLDHEVTLVALTECDKCKADILINEEVQIGDSFTCPKCGEEHVIETIWVADREIDLEVDPDAKVTGTLIRFNQQ